MSVVQKDKAALEDAIIAVQEDSAKEVNNLSAALNEAIEAKGEMASQLADKVGELAAAEGKCGITAL